MLSSFTFFKSRFINNNKDFLKKVSSCCLCIATLFYQIVAIAQMTPSTPAPFLNVQSFVGANGTNGPDAYCDTYKP